MTRQSMWGNDECNPFTIAASNSRTPRAEASDFMALQILRYPKGLASLVGMKGNSSRIVIVALLSAIVVMISLRIPKVAAFSNGNGSLRWRLVSFPRSAPSQTQTVCILKSNPATTPRRHRSTSLCMNASTRRSTSNMPSRRDKTVAPLPTTDVQVRSKNCKSGNRGRSRSRSQSFPLLMTAAGATFMTVGATNSQNPLSSVSLAYCQGDSPESNSVVTTPPFDESSLTFDHYNGVTLHLDKIETQESDFKKDLSDALLFWKAEGRKGIWINVPKSAAHFVPVCISVADT